jgi:hypothetical protein
MKLVRFVVSDHFTKLKYFFNNTEVMNKPDYIYNMHQKGCRLTIHHHQKILALEDTKRVNLITAEHAENVTVLSCANALRKPFHPGFSSKESS